VLPHIIDWRRSRGCAGRTVASFAVAALSFTPWIGAAAQDATVTLPTISVTSAPPAQPGNQSSGDATVVSPSTVVTPSDQSASSTTVITADQIESQQLRTVPDALMAVPGLNVVQTGGPGGQTSVFMRGTNSNHVKVLIDGIDVSDPSNPNASFDFGQLLTGDIERIEVLRGPQSGLYGSDAIGGVISITTKSGNGPPKVTLSTEGGSFGTTNERASLSGSQANFNYVFNVQHFQSTDTQVTPTNLLLPGEARIPNFYDNWTYSTKLGATITDDLAVNLVSRYTDSKLQFTGNNPVAFPSFPEPDRSTQVDHQSFTRGEIVWSPTSWFKNYFGVNYTNEWTWNLDPNADNLLAPPPVAPPTTNLGQRLKFDWRGEAQVMPGELLILGAEQETDTLRTNSNDTFDAFGNSVPFTQTAQSAYQAGWIELQSQFSKRFYLVSNVRYDDYDSFGDHTTWRVAPVYIVPVTDTKLKVTYGTGFKAPSLSDLYVSEPQFGFTANPNLKPEESKGWDAGFEQPIANDQFRFGATYFRNDITNLINDNATFTSLVNIGSASMFGAETFAAWSVSRSLSLRADYTYTVAKDDDTGGQLARRPKNKASLTANWQATDRLSLSSTLLYVGSWWDIDRDTFATEKAPGFMTVNLAANYALTDSATLFARIDNLFNKQYENPMGFLQPGFGAYAGIRLAVGGAPSNSSLPNVIPATNGMPLSASPRGQGAM
jgi:vitamin B12 transporter